MTEQHCINGELYPVVHFNGEGLCSVHAEQRADFSEREAPLIVHTKPVKISPQKGASTKGTPRHYK